MSAELVVAAFARHLQICADALAAQFISATRLHPAEPLLLLPVEGGPGVRVGLLNGLGHFELHGSGCRIDLLTGEVVDFDWDADRREVFDAWRLHRFARSVGAGILHEETLAEAARQDTRLVEVRTGWFAITHP